MDEEEKPEETGVRSPKVRGILGTKPHWIIRRGIGLLALVFAALAITVGQLEYPHGNGESILEHILRQLKWF